MPDSKDFSRYLPDSNRFSLQDMGELAARLWSPVQFDRRGEVVFMDAGQAGIAPWRVYGGGTGNNVSAVGANSGPSGFAIRLTPGSDGGKTAGMSRTFSPARWSRTGFEIGVCLTTSFDYLWIDIDRYDGLKRHLARLKLDYTNLELRYWNSAGADVTIDTITDPTSVTHVHNSIKLVGDMDNFNYVRVIYNQEEYELAGIPLYLNPAFAAPQVLVALTAHGTGAGGEYLDITQSIITGNEP